MLSAYSFRIKIKSDSLAKCHMHRMGGYRRESARNLLTAREAVAAPRVEALT
jgi:hypothetical protein